MSLMRAWFNRWRRRLLHRVLFGERSQGRWLPNTRISPTCVIEHEDRLVLHDHVHIGPFCFIEAGAGLTLGEGVQITSHVSIVTHSSHRAMRLTGKRFVAWPGERPGWIKAPVVVGAYSFIGPHAVVEAGSQLGRGTLVRAGSVVRGTFADFAVLDGRPAVVVGDTRDADDKLLARYPELRALRAEWADGA